MRLVIFLGIGYRIREVENVGEYWLFCYFFWCIWVEGVLLIIFGY